MKSVILVMDSGIGGLTTLKALTKYAPNRYVYFADYKNHPYGDKDSDFITNNVLKIIKQLRDNFEVRGIIIACNTLSAVALETIRIANNDILVIGIEPAVNLAIKQGAKHVLVLATPNTIKYANAIRSVECTNSFFIKSMPTLATDIEDNIFNLQSLLPQLNKDLNDYKKVDSVVLGCTHYLYVKSLFKHIFSPSITFYDGNMGVARRCKALLGTSQNEVNLITNDIKMQKQLDLVWQLIEEGLCVE